MRKPQVFRLLLAGLVGCFLVPRVNGETPCGPPSCSAPASECIEAPPAKVCVKVSPPEVVFKQAPPVSVQAPAMALGCGRPCLFHRRCQVPVAVAPMIQQAVAPVAVSTVAMPVQAPPMALTMPQAAPMAVAPVTAPTCSVAQATPVVSQAPAATSVPVLPLMPVTMGQLPANFQAAPTCQNAPSGSGMRASSPESSSDSALRKEVEEVTTRVDEVARDVKDLRSRLTTLNARVDHLVELVKIHDDVLKRKNAKGEK